MASVLFCNLHLRPRSLHFSDREVYRKHSFLSHLQLPVQDHPSSAVPVHQVPLRPAVPRSDDPPAGACNPAGKVCVCVWEVRLVFDKLHSFSLL